MTRVELLKLTETALLVPNKMVKPLTKLDPVMVTSMLPASGPLVGAMLTMAGGSGGDVKKL